METVINIENEGMIFLGFLAWTLIVIILFAFIPNNKIKMIINFFKVVIPKIPIDEITKFFKK